MAYKVLLAEDEQLILRAYKDELERSGLLVLTATDGVEAMEKIKSEKPDLIVLDLMLPLQTGFKILEELQMNEELKRIPIVILSNLSQDYSFQSSKELGAVDYFVKDSTSMENVITKIKHRLITTR